MRQMLGLKGRELGAVRGFIARGVWVSVLTLLVQLYVYTQTLSVPLAVKRGKNKSQRDFSDIGASFICRCFFPHSDLARTRGISVRVEVVS